MTKRERRDDWEREARLDILQEVRRGRMGITKANRALAALASTEPEQPASEGEHETWCNSHELDLCSGCSVLKGWDRSGVTGEPTTCNKGKPHEFLPKPCSCGPNDQRRGDRRALLAQPGEQGEPCEHSWLGPTDPVMLAKIGLICEKCYEVHPEPTGGDGG